MNHLMSVAAGESIEQVAKRAVEHVAANGPVLFEFGGVVVFVSSDQLVDDVLQEYERLRRSAGKERAA